MEAHTLRVLEFDKIVNLLAEQAACSLGRERALELVPQRDVNWISRMLAETTEARAIIEGHSTVPLGGITDIRPLLSKSQIGSMLTPVELLAVAHTLGTSRRLRSFLVKFKEEYPLMSEIGGRIVVFEKLETSVAQSINGSGEIVDSATPTLAKIRSEQRTKHSRIMERLNSLIQSSKYRTAIQEPVITQRSDRYCIPVKIEYRSQIKGIVHDSSSSGATVFVEPEQIVDLGNDLKQLEAREREEVEAILRELTLQVAAIAPDALNTMEVVAHIDFVTAKARLSSDMGGVEPVLNTKGCLRLVSARHPLLAGDVVPIDVELGQRFRVLLITGPNTGGKTVTLKTIGLLTLMAQSGLHISAGVGSEIAVFDQVFADIGDEQSIEQSLSTFSSHVRNIVHVMNSVGANSLVLFDELGAGTDPAEGAALAKSILEALLEKGARTVATTHYGELKEFAFLHDAVQNASVEFDPVTLRPTYRLMVGVPGSSNAFYIAARLGMPERIIARAQEEFAGREDDSEEIIRRIEESHRAALEDQREARKSATEAEILRRRYEEQLRKLEVARSKVEEEVRNRGKQVIERYSKRLERDLEQLEKTTREGKRSERLKQEIKNSLEHVREELIVEPEPEPDLPTEGVEFKKGDIIRIANMNQEGFLAEDPQDGEAIVVIGTMRVKMPVSSIRPSSKKSVEQAPQASTPLISLTKTTEISPELKLIAQRAEEAAYLLDRYIDGAHAAGLEQVRIIHGKGTGVLRSVVWEFLKDNPAVESFRLGEQEEGGSGATVVILKH